MNKQEEQRPKKQGGLYSLNLGQNNGPFLTKDIMLTNDKSLRLLHGKDNVASQAASILKATQDDKGPFDPKGSALDLNQPQDYYDDKLKSYQNYDERYKAKLNAAENVSCNTQFAEQAIKMLEEQGVFLKELIDDYRQDVKQMHQQIHNSNMNNIREIQPMLKDFHAQLKEKLLDGKNDNYQLQRELEQLQREKLQIQQQILFSHKRILDLEKQVGTTKVDDEQKEEEFNDMAEDQRESQSDSQNSDLE